MVATKPATEVWEDVWVPTACDMCYNACTIKVRRVNGVAVKIEGIPEAPPNYGKLCAKGHAALMNLYSPHRILTPLLRTNPEKGIGVDPRWREISWEEAMELFCAKLREVRERDPRGLVGTSWDTNSFIPFGAFCSGFGTRNVSVVSAGYYCGNGVHAVAYNVTGANDVHPDLSLCHFLMLFGVQTGFANQQNAMALTQEMAEARRRGMKLVVVDPVLTYAASQADEWIPIRPGTDTALALSMMHLLINELGLYDEEFLRRYTNAPYLLSASGRYLREEGTAKPLVWDRQAGKARPYDVVDPQDTALEDVPLPTAFQRFREHLCSYTPEWAAEITTVPPETIRRLARQFGENARIGAKILLEGIEMPYRPVCAHWYRGISAHKHGMLNGMTLALLNAVVGAIDVPGGLLNSAAAGPGWLPREGPDGLILSTIPYLGKGHHNKPLPPRPVRSVESVTLLELFPVSNSSQPMLWLGILDPERYGLSYRPEMLIHCRTNFMVTSANPQLMAEALKRFAFQVSFVDHHNETSAFADLILPDAHALEHLTFGLNPYVHYRHVPLPGGYWTFSVQQPVLPPRGQARYWIEVLLEAAERVGFLGEMYAAFNVLAELEGLYRLDPKGRYTWEEILDRWLRAWCGDEHGLEYFRQHGYCRVVQRTVQESYPRIFHAGRIPLYLEHFLQAGEEVRRYTQEHGIPWDTSDYVALVQWQPCPAYQPPTPEYDLFLVNYKVPFLTHSLTAENPWLMDLAERNTKVFNVGINAETARRKGIRDGDPIELETPAARKAQGTARVTQGVHPEVLAVPSILGRWITANPRARQGVHFNSLIHYDVEQLDSLSAALDACIRVKVRKV